MSKRLSPQARRKARNKKARLEMVEQTVIAEIQTKSIETVKLSRIRYRDNEYSFIDIRAFQRGSDDTGDDVYYPTRRGVQMKESDFKKLVTAHFVDEVERKL